jgi:hypothetical protein
VNSDLDSTLKLNLQTLKNNRKAVLDGAIEALRRARPEGGWPRAFLEKAKSTWLSRDGDGSFRPYCNIVVSYIDKKLNQL